MKVFVQITSYRDPELSNTIKDCINKAKNPENLTFGVCRQYDEDNKDETKEFLSDSRFRFIDVPWTKSEGVGWAKSLAQSLYNKEEYTLQIDSHHRFKKNWDQDLIRTLNKIESKKAILSSFAGAYRSSNNEKLSEEPYKISIAGFDEESKLPILRADVIGEWTSLSGPVNARFVCGHYIFTYGTFCDEYKHDPEVYFEGIDVSMSVRCFTMGYDLYHPNENFLWHEYTRDSKNKHWLDHTRELEQKGLIKFSWKERDENSKSRIKQLLGIKDSGIDLGEFGLGDSRSLLEYQLYAGLDFSKSSAHLSAIKGDPPSKELPTEEEWRKELKPQEEKEGLSDYSLKVSWNKEDIEEADDYEFWFFGFHNEEHKEIYRGDFNKGRNKDILNFEKTEVEVQFKSKTKPKVCIIWPYSKSKGWLKRIAVTIQEVA